MFFQSQLAASDASMSVKNGKTTRLLSPPTAKGSPRHEPAFSLSSHRQLLDPFPEYNSTGNEKPDSPPEMVMKACGSVNDDQDETGKCIELTTE